VCPGRRRSSCRGIAVRFGVAHAPPPDARCGRCLSMRVTFGAWLKRGASGSPVPRRRTLAPAIVASVRSEPASLRHPWLRSHPTPALGARATPRFQRRAVCITASLYRHRPAARMAAPMPAGGARPSENGQDASSGARITQDWPSGRRPPCRRAEPAQAKTGRMPRVEPASRRTGRPDDGPHAGGRSPPKRKRAGCLEWSPHHAGLAVRTTAPMPAGGARPSENEQDARVSRLVSQASQLPRSAPACRSR
jgi:hypothetical protein